MSAVSAEQGAKATASKASKKSKQSAGVDDGAASAISVPSSVKNGEDKINDIENSSDSPFIKDLQRNIRNVTKKLAATHKVDTIIAENPNLSLDELVATRKINADQKAQALKKPGLQQSLAMLEEQLTQYQKFEDAMEKRWAQERQQLEAGHAAEMEQLKATAKLDAASTGDAELKQHLLVLSKFLRAAAARRQVEDDQSNETKAFEGMLLLLYGGDHTAVEAAEKLLKGTADGVPSTDGVTLGVTYGQIKKLAVDFAPYAGDEGWVDDVPPAEHNIAAAYANGAFGGVDPTIANAGLTELDGQTAALTIDDAQQHTTLDRGSTSNNASNAAAAQWDNSASTDPMAESWVSVPRDPAETESAPVAAPANLTQSWADDQPSDPLPTPIANANDGFREVHHHGRGRGRGEHRGGRGRGGPRGGGEGGPRGRGGFRGDRGGGEGGYRGRGRGGRGGRGRGES